MVWFPLQDLKIKKIPTVDPFKPWFHPLLSPAQCVRLGLCTLDMLDVYSLRMVVIFNSCASDGEN